MAVCVTFVLVTPEASEAKVADAGMGGVDKIIPEFQTGKQWEAASNERRAYYNNADAHYKKTHEKAYKAQGAERKKLNDEAQKALTTLKKAKEGMQKKYADDNPADNGMGKLTSADKANEKLYKKRKKTNSGSMGASGTPGRLKWYSNGVISSDSYRDEKGHYILGAHRRRIGAGFARRRAPAVVIAANVTHKELVKAMEKGHGILKEGLGEPKHDNDNQKADPVVENKAADEVKQAAREAEDAKSAEKKKAEEEKLPAGVVEADKKILKPETVATLKATGAGVDAQVDQSGHFTRETEEKILGKDEADSLEPPQDAAKEAAAADAPAPAPAP